MNEIAPSAAVPDWRIMTRLYESAFRRNPADLAAAGRLADIRARHGDRTGALAVWREHCAAAPDDARAWQRLAEVQVTWNMIGEALAAATRAVELDPALSRGHSTLGFALRANDHHDEADRAFAEALRLDGTNRDALRGTGQALIRAGDYAAHVAHVEHGLDVIGPYAWLLAQYTLSLAMLGRDRELHRLLDYDRLVREEIIALPAGFGSLDAFNAELAEELHAVGPEPSGGVTNDVVRDGLRVDGGPARAVELTGTDGAPASAALLSLLQDHLARYRDTLPDSIVRKAMPSDYHLNTQALITRRQAYVDLHSHACSWVGMVYYPVVPDRTTRSGKDGFMEFAPPLAKAPIPPDRWPTRTVEAIAGKLVIFPGYMYHHVHASRVDGMRIAVTVDVHPGEGTMPRGVTAARWLESERQE